MTVARLENEIDYTELSEWEEFFEHEINSHEKLDYYLAQISCTIAQANAAKGKKYGIKDFLIKFKSRNAEKISPRELASRVCSWFGISIPGGK